MAILKCKMCGGDLEVNAGLTVAECEFCGTRQTLPKANDEVIQNLFNRANNLRIKCEFDKAEQIYEKILQEHDGEAEAHWGIVLCKYGIEYVEDPKTFKRIPTCHRTSYDAVTATADYLAAIEHADALQRSIYEEEARVIDALQKDILNIVKNEKPFDVFLCYKETDEEGRRTPDSVIANDIYHQLTQEGLKVFYAAITLEDKLGQEYEPYIFAALNSAKVMLVIGTKPQFFSAVWVKNEWSRFLKLMKSDRSKLLIPCYKDMDAYDLPEEFAHLQAQDMGKIGFINDVVRGIRKIAPAASPATPVSHESPGNTATAPLLKRAFLFLEDGDWSSADEYCEKVLDLEPENARAYLGKLMVELRVKKQEDLKDQAEPFDQNNNYQKVLRFADEKLKTALTGYIDHINTRNENARLNGIYTRAQNAMSQATTDSAFQKAARLFESIGDYENSAELAQLCHKKAKDAQKDAILAAGIAAETGSDYRAAIKLFESISGWKNADELLADCRKKEELARREAAKKAKQKKRKRAAILIVFAAICAVVVLGVLLVTVIIPNAKYNKAIALIESGDYAKSYDLFCDLDGYKDSNDYLSRYKFCYDKIVEDSDDRTLTREYDSKGNLIKEVKTKSDGYIFTAEYTYDSNGNMTKEVETDSDGYSYTCRYTYDSNGNITKEVVTHSDGYIYMTEYTYDSNGNMSKAVQTLPDGDIDCGTYIYDRAGNLTKAYWDSHGDIFMTEYTYDSNGNMTKEVKTDSDGNIYMTEYTYDSRGNVTKEVKTDSDGNIFTDEYTYDSNGNKTKAVETNSAGYSNTFRYTYDSRGNLTKEVFEGTGYSREYTYDSRGNVTKRVEKKPGDDASTTRISYFGEHVVYKP